MGPADREGGRALPVRPISEGGNSRGGAAAGPALALGPGAKRGPGPGTARKATEGSRPAPREQQTEPHTRRGDGGPRRRGRGVSGGRGTPPSASAEIDDQQPKGIAGRPEGGQGKKGAGAKGARPSAETIGESQSSAPECWRSRPTVTPPTSKATSRGAERRAWISCHLSADANVSDGGGDRREETAGGNRRRRRDAEPRRRRASVVLLSSSEWPLRAIFRGVVVSFPLSFPQKRPEGLFFTQICITLLLFRCARVMMCRTFRTKEV